MAPWLIRRKVSKASAARAARPGADVEMLALALQIVFLGLAFGLRAYLHARKTGSPGFRLGARRTRAEAIGAGGIAVAGLGSLIVTILAFTDTLGSFRVLDYIWLQWVGATIAGLGLIIVLAAQSNMGRSWRIGVDQSEMTDLVTGGLFGLVRNPIFLGMLLFWAGMALLAPNAISIASFAVALISIEMQVRLVEEPYLTRTHGDAYLAYASRTGRLLPGIGRLRGVRNVSR